MHIVPMREEPVRKVSAKYHVTGQVSRNHNGGLDAVRCVVESTLAATVTLWVLSAKKRNGVPRKDAGPQAGK